MTAAQLLPTTAPDLPPQAEVAAQGSPSHLQKVQDIWTALQQKGIPPRKPSPSLLYTNNITVNKIYRSIDYFRLDTLLHTPMVHFTHIPSVDEETEGVCR